MDAEEALESITNASELLRDKVFSSLDVAGFGLHSPTTEAWEWQMGSINLTPGDTVGDQPAEGSSRLTRTL